MNFIRIQPELRRVEIVDAKGPRDVDPFLYKRGVDHGVIFQDHIKGYGIAIVVYEFGLLEGHGPYFGLRGQLYSGDAILYMFDSHGETVSFDRTIKIEPLWLPTPDDAETAIKCGLIERPCASINGIPTWEWRPNAKNGAH